MIVQFTLFFLIYHLNLSKKLLSRIYYKLVKIYVTKQNYLIGHKNETNACLLEYKTKKQTVRKSYPIKL